MEQNHRCSIHINYIHIEKIKDLLVGAYSPHTTILKKKYVLDDASERHPYRNEGKNEHPISHSYIRQIANKLLNDMQKRVWIVTHTLSWKIGQPYELASHGYLVVTDLDYSHGQHSSIYLQFPSLSDYTLLLVYCFPHEYIQHMKN